MTMTWTHWRLHFERTALRPVPWVEDSVPALRARPLARILARFQLGEAGEGRIAREIDGVALPEIDDDYRRALKLFVKEEARHARVLAAIVRGLGGRLLARGPSERLFRRGRRMFGVRFKLLVLLVAEILGGAVYAPIAACLRGTNAGVALQQITDDEASHLVFHAELLGAAASLSGSRRIALRVALWAVALGALAVVVLENARDLRAAGIALPRITADAIRLLREADQRAFATAGHQTASARTAL